MKNLLLFGALALSINAFGQVPNYVPTNGLFGRLSCTSLFKMLFV
ncbi:MAG: hypothetical protein P8H43_04900 [Crocinitomicaceae bacterium]|nr:hypothetical protein [Crocinitomicaceae bacterium]